MKNKISLGVCLSLVSAFCGCGGTQAPEIKQSQPSAAAPAGAPPSAPATGAVMDPSSANAKAPAVFKVRFATTSGDFVVEVHRNWSPQGADRFYNLVKVGFYDGVAFFRDISDFMVQFGIHGDPAVMAKWREAHIPDDPNSGHSNTRGAITFATAGPGTRTTQVFINFNNNAQLDGMGFTPFGTVVDGMEYVHSLYNGYGEGAPRGMGPDQGRLQAEGNAYLVKEFPKLDYVKTARLEP